MVKCVDIHALVAVYDDHSPILAHLCFTEVYITDIYTCDHTKTGDGSG